MNRAQKTVEELEEESSQLYPNPEDSIYYHPTLNPFGAPPPGQRPLFRCISRSHSSHFFIFLSSYSLNSSYYMIREITI
jgi:hypothetical protein